MKRQQEHACPLLCERAEFIAKHHQGNCFHGWRLTLIYGGNAMQMKRQHEDRAELFSISSLFFFFFVATNQRWAPVSDETSCLIT